MTGPLDDSRVLGALLTEERVRQERRQAVESLRHIGRGDPDGVGVVTPYLAQTVLALLDQTTVERDELQSAVVEMAVRQDVCGMVREFHESFGFHVEDAPVLPPERVRADRARIVTEEAAELVAELLAGLPGLLDIYRELTDLFESRAYEPDRRPAPARVANELGDLAYVTAGTAVAYGIPLPAVVAEIHRANMAKLDADGRPIVNGHGKAVKPPNWQPPDVSGVLAGAVRQCSGSAGRKNEQHLFRDFIKAELDRLPPEHAPRRYDPNRTQVRDTTDSGSAGQPVNDSGKGGHDGLGTPVEPYLPADPCDGGAP